MAEIESMMIEQLPHIIYIPTATNFSLGKLILNLTHLPLTPDIYIGELDQRWFR